MAERALAADLDDVLGRTEDDWDHLRGTRLLITGGTGFVGSWLLETFTWAVDRLALDATAVVLTRDPDGFAARAPHLAGHPALGLTRGDVLELSPSLGKFGAVVHAATPSSNPINDDTPLVMVDTIIEGTRGALDVAVASGSVPFLFTSSGAVYGTQPPDLSHVGEDHAGGPDPLSPKAAYAEGKRLAELLCAAYARTHGVPTKIARGFTFVGPYLPLDIHFAIGNFVRDALAGRPIVVQGDGTTVRSYLYAADYAAWLWSILARGAVGQAYNVGSEDAVDIAATARAVAAVTTPRPDVEIRGEPVPGRLPDRYVPSTLRARSELGLAETVDLDDALRRTLAWHRARSG
ncbi:MAG: NAD-dependent epimerase/dehydratase family protein [Actinomycetota bacterium]